MGLLHQGVKEGLQRIIRLWQKKQGVNPYVEELVHRDQLPAYTEGQKRNLGIFLGKDYLEVLSSGRERASKRY
jgi:hypothetical protein